MKVDLIIDGNFVLSKLVFTLHKNNILYGLNKALETAVSNYRKWYPFANIYLVSDSREKSWRKEYIDQYKTNRKKDSDIDWIFVYNAYDEFKQQASNGIKVLEAPSVEGDDWISYLVERANRNSRSVIIVSNDYDIKQLVRYNLDPLTINVMTNEMYNKEKLFLPKNYQIFINAVNKLPNDDVFNLNDNSEFLLLMDRFINKYEIHEINSVESLFIKLIAGDKSDNINSAWSITKNGKKRGIGQAGASMILEQYIKEFGEPNLTDPDLYENIADLICEKKKLSKSNISNIVNSIKLNFRLICLDTNNLPNSIINIMNDRYLEKGE